MIHTVGPVWIAGDSDEDKMLASCYDECLKLAEANGVRTLAFPAISTGVYRYPKDLAARVAVDRVTHWLTSHSLPERVTFCCFTDDDAQVYHEILRQPDADVDAPPSEAT